MRSKLFLKILLSSIFALSLSSCYTPKTHGRFITEQKDAWIDSHAIRISGHEYVDKGLVYCRSNVKENGLADPVCFKARFEEYEDKKSHAKKSKKKE